MNDKLTVTDALAAFEHNPHAAALALGMVLMQESSEEINNINNSINNRNEEKIKLEEELAYWIPLALKNILTEPEHCT